MHLHLSPSFITFSVIWLILYNVEPSSASSSIDYSPYQNCMSNSSRCGTSTVKLAYPFWGMGHPEYCGHPGFKLSCDGGKLTINITSQTYNVIDINYNTSIIRIANEEFSQGDCPATGALHNTTVDMKLFNYTSNVKNATLFYDCPQSRIFKNAPFSFSCAGRDPNTISFFVITKDWENELDGICRTKVYVPVFRNAIQDLFGNSSSVVNVLKKGFELKWVIGQGHCQECFISGGCCGYNMTLGLSTCFCENGAAYATFCPPSIPSKGMSLEAKVGIGLAAGVGGLFILITLIVFVRPKKDYHSSSSVLSQKDSRTSTMNIEEKSTYFGAQLFTYKELQQATNNFDPTKELGKGGFGTVYYGKLQDGRDVAIKRLYEKHKKQESQFMNELEILTRMDHKHLVKLYGCSPRKSRELLLVYEYVANGTVADHLHGRNAKNGPLPWPVRLRIAIETASALVHLHASDIIHRDVKTRNILLDVNYSVKVADFGLSRLFPLDVTHVSTTPQGSPGYVDPEYYQCYQLTDKSDVYSLGVVLAELISAKPAVDRSRSREEINLSNMVINNIQKKAWGEFVDPCLRFDLCTRVREEVIAMAELTFRCLQATRETRPTMEEVLEALTSIQTEKSSAEIVDIPRDVAVVFNGCDSLASSNGSEDSDKIKIAESSTRPTATDSPISVVVNISSDVFKEQNVSL